MPGLLEQSNRIFQGQPTIAQPSFNQFGGSQGLGSPLFGGAVAPPPGLPGSGQEGPTGKFPGQDPFLPPLGGGATGSGFGDVSGTTGQIPQLPSSPFSPGEIEFFNKPLG